MDYTASDLEDEHKLWYFREDVGINLRELIEYEQLESELTIHFMFQDHWHWHLGEVPCTATPSYLANFSSFTPQSTLLKLPTVESSTRIEEENFSTTCTSR
jgi:hypothetical protein